MVFGIRLSIATIFEQADNLEATARAAAYQDCHAHCKLPMPAFVLGCCGRCHRLLFRVAHYFLDGLSHHAQTPAVLDHSRALPQLCSARPWLGAESPALECAPWRCPSGLFKV